MGPLYAVIFWWPVVTAWAALRILWWFGLQYWRLMAFFVRQLLRKPPPPAVHGDADWASLKTLKNRGHLDA